MCACARHLITSGGRGTLARPNEAGRAELQVNRESKRQMVTHPVVGTNGRHGRVLGRGV